MRRLSVLILLAFAAAIQSGCAVYRYSSPDHPSKLVWKTPPGEERIRVKKIRGQLFAAAGGKVSVTADELNRTLASLWPDRFSSEEDALPLSIRLEGRMPGFGPNNLGRSYGGFGSSFFFMMCLGVLRQESQGTVSASILVDHATWSRPGKASVERRVSICCQPLLFPVAYPLLRVLPPREADWPVDEHFGSIAYENADQMQRVAVDLAASAVAKAVQALSPDDLAAVRSRILLTGEQIAARQRLDEGATTFSVRTNATDGAVAFSETGHEFKEGTAGRGVPRVVEQRYDPATRRGFVAADLSECDPDKGYAYLTTRLIPAICETKNVVLSVDNPPPAHAEFRLLGEERDPESGIQTIEFEALQ